MTTQEDTRAARLTPPWGALWVLALALAMIVLDGSIVNVSIPTIINAIHINLADAQWITSLYNIVLAALLLPFGKLGDARGRKTVLQVGVVVFVASSLIAAGAQNASMLLVARALQGIGGAMIMPTTLSTVSASFQGKYRAAAFGVWGAVMSAAAAIGPLLGGWFTQSISWRWIFLVNLPLGLVVFVAAILFVPQTGGRAPERDGSRIAAARSGNPSRPEDPGESGKLAASGVDGWGIALSALASAFLVFGLIEGETYGWWGQNTTFTIGAWRWGKDWPISPIPICLVMGVALFAAFLWIETRRGRAGKAVTLDMRLFKIPTFSWGNLAAGAISAGEFAIIFVLPLYLINARSLSTLQAGGMLAAMAVGALISGGSARHIAARLGPAGTVQLGLVLEIVGVIGSIALMPSGVNPWMLLIGLLCYGFGLGLAAAQLTSVVLSEVPLPQSGEGSATQSTVRQLGTALGSAISGTSLSVAVHAILPGRLAAATRLPAAVSNGLVDAVSGSAGNAIASLRAQGTGGSLGLLGPKVVDAMTGGFIEGGQWAMGIAGSMLIVGLAASVMVRRATTRH